MQEENNFQTTGNSKTDSQVVNSETKSSSENKVEGNEPVLNQSAPENLPVMALSAEQEAISGSALVSSETVMQSVNDEPVESVSQEEQKVSEEAASSDAKAEESTETISEKEEVAKLMDRYALDEIIAVKKKYLFAGAAGMLALLALSFVGGTWFSDVHIKYFMANAGSKEEAVEADTVESPTEEVSVESTATEAMPEQTKDNQSSQTAEPALQEKEVIQTSQAESEEVATDLTITRVKVLNSTRINDAAGKMYRMLKERGLRRVSYGNASQKNYEGTNIYFQAGQELAAQKLQAILKSEGYVVGLQSADEKNSDMQSAQLVVIIGKE